MIFLRNFQFKNLKEKMKRDYKKLKKMQFINYNSFWCMEENKVLQDIEKRGEGG